MRFADLEGGTRFIYYGKEYMKLYDAWRYENAIDLETNEILMFCPNEKCEVIS